MLRSRFFLSVFTLWLALLAFVFVRTMFAEPLAVNFTFAPTNQTVPAGTPVTVTIQIVNASEHVHGFQFDLNYDKAILSPKTADAASWFRATGRDVVCTSIARPTATSIRFACGSRGGILGNTGNGDIATVSFLAIGYGTSPISLSNAKIMGVDSPPTKISVGTTGGATIIVSGGTIPTVPTAVELKEGGTADQSHLLLQTLFFLSLLLLAILSWWSYRRARFYAWLFLLLGFGMILPRLVSSVFAQDATTRNVSTTTSPLATSACNDFDINCDNDIDIFDVSALFPFWNCTPGMSCYNAAYDRDSNNLIDIYDLQYVGNAVLSPILPTTEHCGTLTSNESWPATHVHVISCDLIVPDGKTLTIAPNAIVKFNAGALFVEGTLNASGGLATTPVIFTAYSDDSYGGDTNGDGNSYYPDAGSWTSIQIAQTGNATFNYAVIRYGGQSSQTSSCYSDSSGFSVDGMICNHGVLTLTHSILTHSAQYGIVHEGKQTTITDNSMLNNYGGYIDFTYQTALSTSTIGGNTGQGMYIVGNVSNGTVNLNENPDDSWYGIRITSIDLGATLNIGTGVNSFFSSSTINGVLNVEAGTILKMDWYAQIANNGVLNVRGTSANPVVFTSTRDDSYGWDTNGDGSDTLPAPGDWSCIITSETGTSTFDYAKIRYGGYSCYDDTSGSSLLGTVSNWGNLVMTNSDIAYSASYYGIEHRGKTLLINNNAFHDNSTGASVDLTNQTTVATITNNSFNNNHQVLSLRYAGNALATVTGNTGTGNTDNFISLGGSIDNGAVNLVPNGDYVYTIGINIGQAGTVNIEAGTILKMGSLTNHGVLNVRGTSANPVVFTSLKDDSYGGDTNGDGSDTLPAPGDWDCILTNETGTSTFDYATIRYGGGNCYYLGLSMYPAIFSNYGNLVMTNSDIAYSAYDGIYHGGKTLSLISNEIHENTSTGIYTDLTNQTSSATIRDNKIWGNTNYGIYNAGPSQLKAEYNWWGSDSGPIPHGSGNSINYSECYDAYNNLYICEYHVDAAPWLGSQNSAYSSSALVTAALPPEPIRNVSPSQPDVPYITKLTPNFTGMYLLGFPFQIELMAEVDWNGSSAGSGTPGSVDFSLNGQTVTINASGNQVVWKVPDERLLKGTQPNNNQIKITAQSDGISSTPTIHAIPAFEIGNYFWGLPEAKYEYIFEGSQLKYKTEGTIPLSISAADGSSEVPGSQMGFGFEGISFAYELSSKGTGEVGVSGTRDLIEFKGGGASVKVEIEPQLSGTFNLMGDRMTLVEIMGEVKASGTIKSPKAPLPPPASIFQAQLAFKPATKFSYGLVEAGTGVGPTLPGHLQFARNGEIEVKGIVEGIISLGTDEVASLEGGFGVGPVLTLVMPSQPGLPADGYVKKLGVEAYLRAKAQVLFLVREWKVGWSCNRDYSNNQFNCPVINSDGSWRSLGEPMFAEVSDWTVTDRKWVAIDQYAQFVGNSGSRSAEGMYDLLGVADINASSTVTLTANTYPYGNPALAVKGNKALLVWTHDEASKLVDQGLELRYAYWNGTAWTAPASVTNDTLLDVNPVSVVDKNGNVLVVWSRATGQAGDPRNSVATYELVYNIFNMTTLTWGSAQALTTNSLVDALPNLAKAPDGSVVLTWLEAQASNYPISPDETISPSSTIRLRTWNGTSWGAVSSVVADAPTASMVAIAKGTTATAAAWIADGDGDASTSADSELYVTTNISGTWSTPLRLTNNSTSDSSPQLARINDQQLLLVWVTGEVEKVVNGELTTVNQLSYSIFNGSSWSAPAIGFETGGIEEFQVTSSAENNTILVWQEMGEQGLDMHYALYQPALQSWGTPQALTASDDAEFGFTPGMLSTGQLMIPYMKRDVITQTETVTLGGAPFTVMMPVLTNAHLLVGIHPLKTDLSAEMINIAPSNPAPGDYSFIEATIHNGGDIAVSGVVAKLYHGNPATGGTVITTTTFAEPLVAGESRTVSIYWTVPATLTTSAELYWVVDTPNSVTEINEGNNQLVKKIALPDFAVTTFVRYYDNFTTYPLAVVRNTGVMTATNIPVAFYRDTITGTQLISQVIPLLAPNQEAVITHTFSVAGLPITPVNIVVVVDKNDVILEADEQNNQTQGAVMIAPDLVVWAGDVVVSAGSVSVTVRNWGNAVATNVALQGYDENGAVLFSDTIASLAVDGSVTRTYTSSAATVQLVVDPSNVISELDESNNGIVGSLTP